MSPTGERTRSFPTRAAAHVQLESSAAWTLNEALERVDATNRMHIARLSPPAAGTAQTARGHSMLLTAASHQNRGSLQQRGAQRLKEREGLQRDLARLNEKRAARKRNAGAVPANSGSAFRTSAAFGFNLERHQTFSPLAPSSEARPQNRNAGIASTAVLGNTATSQGGPVSRLAPTAMLGCTWMCKAAPT